MPRQIKVVKPDQQARRISKCVTSTCPIVRTYGKPPSKLDVVIKQITEKPVTTKEEALKLLGG